MTTSPCIGVCEYDAKNDFCKGCKRNGFEIFNWSTFSDEKKKLILLQLKKRNNYVDIKISSRRNSD